MKELLWVGSGGFLGAILRYGLSGWANRRWDTAFVSSFPIGTLIVNVLGCYAIGVLMTLVDRGLVSEQARLFAGVGLLGALTTFSTFGQETLELIRRGSLIGASLNLLTNATIGLAAVWLGAWSARLLGTS